MTFRHTYEEVGFPCRNTMGGPSPVSRYEMKVSSTGISRTTSRGVTDDMDELRGWVVDG